MNVKTSEEQEEAIEGLCRAFGLSRVIFIGANQDFSLTYQHIRNIDFLQAISLLRIEADRIEAIFKSPPKIPVKA